MALIEVTEESLRSLVNDAVFEQAQDWADKVTGLRVDGLLVEATVDGVPAGFLVLRHGLEGRCGCPLPAPCAHAIAAALAWVRAGDDDESPSDLFEVLRVQDQDWLASRLARLAAADPAIAARLLDEAEDVDVLDEVADLRGGPAPGRVPCRLARPGAAGGAPGQRRAAQRLGLAGLGPARIRRSGFPASRAAVGALR
jgi:hypothetical protein